MANCWTKVYSKVQTPKCLFWKTEQNLVFSDLHKKRFNTSSCWLLIRGKRGIMKMRSSIFLKQCFGLCEGFWGFCVGLILNWIIIIASTARSYALYNGQIDNTNLDKSYPPIWTNLFHQSKQIPPIANLFFTDIKTRLIGSSQNFEKMNWTPRELLKVQHVPIT